jgi:hypothetical protein
VGQVEGVVGLGLLLGAAQCVDTLFGGEETTNVVLLVLAGVVAWGRFGPYAL